MDRLDVIDLQVHVGHGLSLEACLAAMDALGIRGALLDELWALTPGREAHSPLIELPNGVRRPVGPGHQMACMLHPDRFKYQLRVDQRDPELAAILRLASDDPHCLAVRTEARQPHEHAALAAGDYGRLFAAAADLGLPVCIMTAGENALLEPYLAEFTSCRFILDHLGHPKGADGWDEVISRLARFSNLHVKWSHAPRAFGGPYPFLATQAELRRAVDAFGRERIMWGSDCTMLRPGDSWANALFYVRESDLLSAEDREWVLGRSARTLLKWPASDA